MSRNPLNRKGFRDIFLAPNRCRFNKKNPRSGIIELPRNHHTREEFCDEFNRNEAGKQQQNQDRFRWRKPFIRWWFTADEGIPFKIGFERLAAAKFKTTDKAKRFHSDMDNLIQVMYHECKFQSVSVALPGLQSV